MTSHTHGTLRDRTGTPAVPFVLTDSAGVTRRLSNHAGRWLLLVFHRHLA
jgi:peroxiredoxin